jgi:hypothetical protein
VKMKTCLPAVACCLVMLVLACARREPEMGESAENDDRDLASLSTQLDTLQRERETLRAGTAAPCPRLCELAESICQVSEKMCAVTARHSDSAEMTAKCEKARATCKDGREDCRTQCKK